MGGPYHLARYSAASCFNHMGPIAVTQPLPPHLLSLRTLSALDVENVLPPSNSHLSALVRLPALKKLWIFHEKEANQTIRPPLAHVG